MKVLDAIKKLNGIKKEDGELLIETIDLKELKGAKEKDLSEAFMTAIESLSEEDTDQYVPEDLAALYNKLAGTEGEQPEPEKKAPAKASDKKAPEKKATEKKATKAPEKKAPAKAPATGNKGKKGDGKVVARTVIAELVKNNKYTLAELVKASAKSGIEEKTVKLYVGAWKRSDRVPFDKKALTENAKTNVLSFVS